ncbi:hypothetical protein [Mycolicibacterium rufum]|uniref:hypothetical protein n=1 Tax=Mycolicibacterium rufum TaxID=318424 RepID=UPI003313A964
MTRPDRDDSARPEPPAVPWHNRTSTLLGASIAALVLIAVLITSASWVSRQFNEPEQAPLNFVDPSFSSTGETTATPTTTGTITSTSPPMTTDINPESTPPTTSGSETSGSETPTGPPPSTRPPRTRDDDADTSTTRKRPRTNVTRTLYPVP